MTLFCILLTRTMTKRTVAWVKSVQPECAVPLGTWNFQNFKPEFLSNEKPPEVRGIWKWPIDLNFFFFFFEKKIKFSLPSPSRFLKGLVKNVWGGVT